jgi:hypothetical protein
MLSIFNFFLFAVADSHTRNLVLFLLFFPISTKADFVQPTPSSSPSPGMTSAPNGGIILVILI